MPSSYDDTVNEKEHQSSDVLIPTRASRYTLFSNTQILLISLCIIIGFLILVPASIVIFHATTILARLAPFLGVAFAVFLLCLMAIGVYGAFGYLRMILKRHYLQMHVFAPDPGTPNYPAYLNDDGTFSQPQTGVVVQSVPHHYAPHIAVHAAKDLPALPSLKVPVYQERTIPSFAESVACGDIAPGQRDILYGWEIIEAPSTHEKRVEPLRGGVELRQTLFLVGGMQCGKSTLVSNWMAQEAAKGDTVFLVIDPHLNIPETSLMARIPALAHAGYLAVPAAGREPKDIARVVKALHTEIDARFAGKETPLSGLKITFVVDEALALARMTRLPKHDPVYDDLLVLMQSVATETAKAGITGIYLAQLSSKEQLGEIDIRDACPGSVILKTPYQQALNLRLTGEEARAATFFEKGHGFFLSASGGEPRRFAFGKTTPQDITNLVARLPGSPLRTQSLHHVHSSASRPPEVEENEERTEIRMQDETASQADEHELIERVLQGLEMGIMTKDGIIEHVWKVKKGKGKDYQQACRAYEHIMRTVSMMARRSIDSQ